jgi:hypothetical protein
MRSKNDVTFDARDTVSYAEVKACQDEPTVNMYRGI